MPLPIIGRKVRVYRGAGTSGDVFLGVTTKTINVNNEPVDITNDDDDGFRRMLDDPGVKFIDIPVEGVFKEDSEMADAIDGDALIKEYTVEVEGLFTITSDFFVGQFELTAGTDDAARYSTTLQSSGPYERTATPVGGG